MTPEILVVAQPIYSNWDPLPVAAEAARQLAESLIKHGLRLADTALLSGADKGHTEATVAEGFAKVSENSCLILFWTGHGTLDGSYYLVCQDSPRTKLSSACALEASALGTFIANSDAEKILVILDTC